MNVPVPSVVVQRLPYVVSQGRPSDVALICLGASGNQGVGSCRKLGRGRVVRNEVQRWPVTWQPLLQVALELVGVRDDGGVDINSPLDWNWRNAVMI